MYLSFSLIHFTIVFLKFPPNDTLLDKYIWLFVNFSQVVRRWIEKGICNYSRSWRSTSSWQTRGVQYIRKRFHKTSNGRNQNEREFLSFTYSFYRHRFYQSAIDRWGWYVSFIHPDRIIPQMTMVLLKINRNVSLHKIM